MIESAISNALAAKRDQALLPGGKNAESRDIVGSLQKIGQGASITVMCVVALALVASLLHIRTTFGPAGLIAMNALTAIALGIAGVSLWLARSEETTVKNKRIAKACAGAAMAL